ncbi:MAG: SOS response-associated peptidase [Dehalococcoidia bacterium]|nr:SOS response-associated peptidase [Dehalococcoidia bacterium]MCB9484916.1 SOS response-associated peptidase [Thermoflexaceae bacterium]
MCGRFTLTEPDSDLLAQELGVSPGSLQEYEPRYNIAPTQEHFVLSLENEDREALRARWGLVNSWAKDAKRASNQINARSETVDKTPAYRSAFKKRRCLVPVDGFFEWDRSGKVRQPYWIHRPGRALMFFAGLYELWQPEPGNWRRTFTIVTTAANSVVANIHDRMPVVLDDADADRWLFPETPLDDLKALLRPADDSLLVMYPVSTRVNKPGPEDASLVEPIALAPAEANS